MTNPKDSKQPARVERTGHLMWVAVADIYVNPRAQRDLRPGWAAQIAADFDPDRFSPPLLSKHGNKFYVVDGQHRIEAMRLMGWEDQQIQCWVYDDLSEAQEADLFLWHNNRKQVNAFDTFQIAVVAERSNETDIDRIVRAKGLKIASGQPGGISATGALRKVYSHGEGVLARTITICNNAYGDEGLKGHIIEGIGLLCAKYNGELRDDEAIAKLGNARGGVGALNSKAYTFRKQMGRPLPHCVAAAATDIINTGRRGASKLPNWWT